MPFEPRNWIQPPSGLESASKARVVVAVLVAVIFPPTEIELEAFKKPLMERLEEKVEDAEEINPPEELTKKTLELSELWSCSRLPVCVPAPRKVRTTDWEEVASMMATDCSNRFGDVEAGEEVPMINLPRKMLGELVAETERGPLDKMPPSPTFRPSMIFTPFPKTA